MWRLLSRRSVKLGPAENGLAALLDPSERAEKQSQADKIDTLESMNAVAISASRMELAS